MNLQQDIDILKQGLDIANKSLNMESSAALFASFIRVTEAAKSTLPKEEVKEQPSKDKKK